MGVLRESYYQSVYRLVSMIPRGKVMTYGQIAKYLGMESARFVGRILHENKDPDTIPCHRVVFVNGKLSKNYAFGGEKAQRKKLTKEGVMFNKNKVNLQRLLYQPK